MLHFQCIGTGQKMMSCLKKRTGNVSEEEDSFADMSTDEEINWRARRCLVMFMEVRDIYIYAYVCF